jgi:hypothetical protein
MPDLGCSYFIFLSAGSTGPFNSLLHAFVGTRIGAILSLIEESSGYIELFSALWTNYILPLSHIANLIQK